jgi:signal transduction histidine kinase
MPGRHDIRLLSPAEQLVFNQFGVRLRYAAVLTAAAVLALAWATDLIPEFPRASALAVTLFVAAYNAAGDGLLRRLRPLDDARQARLKSLQRALTLFDQVTLAVALYILGGLEVFVLPVLMLAMFMVAINTGKRESYRFMASMLGLILAVLLLEHFDLLPYRSAVPLKLIGLPGAAAHNPLASSWWALAATWSIFAVLLYTVVYFSNFVKDKYARVLAEILAGRREITSLRKLSADVLDIFPFAVLTIGAPHGTVEAANPAAVGMLGAHLGWIGRRVGDIEGLADTGLAAYLQRALGGDEITVADFPLLRPDRKKLYLSLNIFVARQPDGAVDKVLLCAEDATERRNRENEQRELQQALLQTEKMASLGQMAAGVAHELNNPLTAIDAYAQFLAFRIRGGESLGPESLQRVERILESSGRIRTLVKNLLSYARPAPESSAALHVTSVIEESLFFCEHEIRRRNVTLVKRYGEGLPRVVGNKTQLQQVFINLVTNAAHAAGEGGRIEIETGAAAGSVAVVVRDNGHGIEPGHRERIFEPFFTTKSAGEGTGLGLSIVVTILEKHGGAIRVESEPGQGTAFHLRLPAEAAAAEH